LVALVRAKFPNLDANNVINRVIETATAQTGEKFSPSYGFGLINPLKALTAEVAEVKANPLGSLAEWVKLYRKDQPDSNTDAGSIKAPISSDQVKASTDFDSSQIVPIGVYVIFGILVIRSVARALRRRK